LTDPITQREQDNPMDGEEEDVEMEEEEGSKEVSNADGIQVHEASGGAQPKKISLRRVLYELENKRGENLIHAVYPSTDATKLFVLCSEENKFETLERIQNLEELVQQIFSPQALSVYFKPHEKSHVQHHPVLSTRQESFVDSLVNLTGTGPNPQEEYQPEVQMLSRTNVSTYASMVSPSPSKRQRNGDAASSKVYQPVPVNTERDAKINASLNETMEKLKQIESNEVGTQDTLTTLSNRLDQQGRDISVLGESLRSTNTKVDKVSETQVLQGSTMVQMDGSLKAILREVSKLNEFNQQFSSLQAESPQGGGVRRS